MTLTNNNLRDILSAKHKPFKLKEFIVDAIVFGICLVNTTILVGLCFASFKEAATIKNTATIAKPVAEKPYNPSWVYRLKGSVK